MLELRLLGSIELHSPHPRPPDLDAILSQPKRTALLAYLALASSGTVVRRDRLLGVFWPEFSQSRARAALRRSLAFLRKRLGDGVLVGQGEQAVGLAGGDFRCDAVTFQRELRDGRPERALQLYRGPLLDGFFVRDTPEFERWVELERWRLRSEATRAAVDVAESAEGRGDLHGAAGWLRRALEITPADEGALRRLISVLARAGERTEAMRTFDLFARQVDELYDMEPSPETRRLIAAITRGYPTGGTAVRRPLRNAGSQARNLAVEAWTLAERSAADNQAAIRLCQRAIHLDESCPEAYAGLAAAYAHGVQLFGRPRVELMQGGHAARTAVSLDPSIPQTHFALGLTLEMAGRLPEAEDAYRTAVGLDPGSGPITSQLGRALMLAGNFAGSLGWAKQSFQLAPEDPHTSLQIALDLSCLRLDDEGDRWYESTLETWPEFVWAEASWAYFALARGDPGLARRRAQNLIERNAASHLGRFTLGMAASLEGDVREAGQIFESLYRVDPSGRHGALLLSTRSFLAHVKLQEGDRDAADQLLREARAENLQALASGGTFGGIFYDQAVVCALSGEDEQALDWLEASEAAGYRQPDYTLRDPALERLHRYDRFDRIVRAIQKEIGDQREAAQPGMGG